MRLFTFSLVAAIYAVSVAALAAAPQHGNPHGGPNSTASTTHGNGTTTTPSGPTTTSPTTTVPPLNPIAQKISTNHGLLPRVTALLPKGMSLDQATLGFKNQGQAIAALHVSRNLHIPFTDLKTAMTGITPIVGPVPPAPTVASPTTTSTSTPQPRLSLGQAIQKLRPSVDSTTEARRAERQASTDVGTVSTAPTSAPKTTTTSTAR